MKYLDEYRDPIAARKLIDAIRHRVSRRWTLMEVCGGQTHGLLRYGIEEMLASHVELLHGPGCPVCVTPMELLDRAQDLSRRHDCIVASFGDMLRVPGSRRTLLDVRAAGGNVRTVYSPLDAVALAQAEPTREVVFLAVGFETTAPATALAVKQAARLGLKNFSMLVAHVRVEPAMQAVLRAPGNRVQGFLAAGHVCTITGLASYESFIARHNVPVVVTGFEPVDLLAGILACVAQLERGEAHVENAYGRSVRYDGAAAAQRLVDEVYEVADCPWRGMGVLPEGGLRLRAPWREFDAEHRFGLMFPFVANQAENECQAGLVLAGRLRPPECPHFGTRCTPDQPMGAPMVSAEGACAAYFRYGHSTSHEPVALNGTPP